ncbi:hypothetical protein AC622_11130 [Bacillus sp. FJAT-27916]|uniref:DUF5412 family protein n=1 Tax=Bacillus sp. FJAT-27916 TaxID=1679169 RepID=UPI0006709C90|nr:DUF5412 family protein [Bacillus sp. FJAT-27916]KMY44711.1 hypothetical protein AC622_11130 [Bacillus sp. FJAT-27916]
MRIIGVVIFMIVILLFFLLCVKLGMFLMRKRAFPSKLLVITLAGIVIVSFIYMYEMYFFTFDRIDRERMQNGPGPIESPSGRYTANAYYEPYGGAAGGVNVWVEITDHDHQGARKTIYYGNGLSEVDLEWIGDDSLFIQNESSGIHKSKELNVKTEIYHGTGLACQSLVMKDTYETCYSD